MDKIFTSDKIGYYNSANICTYTQTPKRIVDTYEIELYVTSTNVSVVNDVQYRQKSGNILVSKPGDVRYSIHPFECYYAHFNCVDDEVARQINALPTVFTLNNIDKISDIFKDLIKANKMRDKPQKLYTQGKLLELIGLLSLYDDANHNDKSHQYAAEIESACSYMKKNIENPITISDIAQQINLSAGFFHKVFKAAKNMTPSQYLTLLRINQAKHMLTGSNTPLSEIAILCGFGSQSYFNYVFSKHTSMTPKHYRDFNQIII